MMSATTTCNAFVSRTINLSGTLQEKTDIVVLSGARGGETADVYRQSSSVPGKYSLERYTLKGGAWGPRRKVRGKLDLPQPPRGAFYEVVDGIECWTMTPMTAEQRQRVRELISTPLGRV